MTRPNEEADRLWLQASQLRLIADELETRAAERRHSRTPFNRERYFTSLAQRDCVWGDENCGHSDCASCHYCRADLHPYDPRHRRVIDTLDGVSPSAAPDLFSCEGACGRCAHIDHATPLAMGGTNELSNLVLACAACNLRKGTKSYETFMRQVILERSNAWDPGDLGLDEPVLTGRATTLMIELLQRLLRSDEEPAWFKAFRLARFAEQVRMNARDRLGSESDVF